MPIVTQHPKLRYALPVPHRRLSLWRGCVWAVNPRATYGREGNTTTTAGFEYVDRKRATIQDGAGIPIMIHNSVLGWAFRSDGTRRLEWSEANAQYTWGNSRNITIAVFMRFIGALPGADKVILTKRFARGGANTGVEFSVNAGNTFRLSWADGANEQTLDSVTLADANFSRLLVGRIIVGGNSSIWINGAQDVQAATVRYPVNSNTIGINMFGSAGAGVGDLSAQVGFAGLWRRALTNSEIAALHTDPWIMWRQQNDPVGPLATMPDCDCSLFAGGANPVNVAPDCDDPFFGAGGNNPAIQTDECCDCQWWPVGAKSKRNGLK